MKPDQIVVKFECGTKANAIMLRFLCADSAPQPNMKNLKPSPDYVLMPGTAQALLEQLQRLLPATAPAPPDASKH